MKIHALVSLLCLTGAAGLAHTGPAHAELVVEDGKVAVAPDEYAATGPRRADEDRRKAVWRTGQSPPHGGQAPHHTLGLPRLFGVFRG